MRRNRLGLARAILVLGTLLAALHAPLLDADPSIVKIGGRRLANPREVRHEIKVAPGTEAAVKDYFPSFFDYQDLVLFHPKVGYYASGRVNFTTDYSTFPDMLAPYFGQMIAEQIFRMWDGMRHARTLSPNEQFTIAEFGAGNGVLAESILDYINQQAKDSPDERWREFARQAVFVSYDRSPALSVAQRERNARFGKQFEARAGDATNPTATIAPGSLKGIILSNELTDVFGVHKVIISPDGADEVAFVVPWLSRRAWNTLSKCLPETAQALIKKDNQAIKDHLFNDEEGTSTYLSRAAFVTVMESLASSPDYASKVRSIQFHEVYVPVYFVPEVAMHLRRYARPYACELAKVGKGVVAYINLGEGKFIQGTGQILRAGYVMTIDYGSSWDEIIPPSPDGHLRVYGPGSRPRDSDPYHWPGLNDITTDVNFSHMAAEGQSVGLRMVYFGPQRALQSGTPVLVDTPSAAWQPTDNPEKEFQSWAEDFQTGSIFKMLVQQKQGTDDSYVYPDDHPQPLDINEDGLNPVQREKAAEIEKKLRSLPVG